MVCVINVSQFLFLATDLNICVATWNEDSESVDCEVGQDEPRGDLFAGATVSGLEK
jgi:hypothetical protein